MVLRKIQGYWIKFPWLRANQTPEYEQTQHILTQKKERLKQRCKVCLPLQLRQIHYCTQTQGRPIPPKSPSTCQKTWPPKPCPLLDHVSVIQDFKKSYCTNGLEPWIQPPRTKNACQWWAHSKMFGWGNSLRGAKEFGYASWGSCLCVEKELKVVKR